MCEWWIHDGATTIFGWARHNFGNEIERRCAKKQEATGKLVSIAKELMHK